MYKYYLIGQMKDADCLPRDGRLSLWLFGSKPFDPSAGCRVCGVAIYDRPLQAQEIQRCHLARAVV